MRISSRFFFFVFAGIMSLLAGVAVRGQDRSIRENDPLPAMVESDWAAQENWRGRSTSTPAAIREALERGDRLLMDLAGLPGAPAFQEEAKALHSLETQANRLNQLDDPARTQLYRQIRWLVRRLALKNPLLAGKPILFLERRRFICQMLHEYIGYYYQNLFGGGVFLLERPGESLKVRDLVDQRLPEGSYTTLSLSFDGRTAYFAYAKKEARPTDYAMEDWFTYTRHLRQRPDQPAQEWRCFHLFALDLGTGRLRQLTSGPDDDIDPCELPDGGIAFMSTRRGGFIRCNNPWEPLPTQNLHRMNPDGSGLRPLSFHETNEWHPSVLHDGRLVYSRWDYVDRSAANYHGLWTTNPDGSNPSSLWGSYTARINACYQARAIPGSRRIAFLAGAHHADVGGSLVLLDPDRVRLDARSGEDDLNAIECLSPNILYPEAPGWSRGYFHSPWPLSENYYLAAFDYAKVPSMSSGNTNRDETGLYYYDRFGNLELLYRHQGIACMYPIPLAPRPRPPVLPSSLDTSMGETGEFILRDVKEGHFPLPANRPIRHLRVFQVLPKSTTHIANKPRLGHANAESARMFLGTVPVEVDGSAFFRVPAHKPLYFQAVDESGRAVQTMRSLTYLQPGERRGCIGCHERRQNMPAGAGDLLAMKRPPSVIEPGPDGTQPFCYTRLIQPILDQHCLRCHHGRQKDRVVLTGEPQQEFTISYNNLRDYVRWHEWGGRSIAGSVTRPGQGGADASPLTKILRGPEHAQEVKLSKAEWLRIYLWLDGNVPFYGVYRQEDQTAQRQGRALPPPVIQ